MKPLRELSNKELDEEEERIGMKLTSGNRELAYGSAILYPSILAEYSRRREKEQRSEGVSK